MHKLAIVALGMLLPAAAAWPAIFSEDDAGSGRDAGDSFESAVTLTGDGPFSGGLVLPNDLRDVFKLTLGDHVVVQFSVAASSDDAVAGIFNPTRDLYQLVPASSETRTIAIYFDQPGEWFIDFLRPSLDPMTYGFSLQRETPSDLVHRYTMESSHVLEVRWDSPSEINAVASAAWGDNLHTSSARGILIEWRIQTGEERDEKALMLTSNNPRLAQVVSIQPGLVPQLDIPIMLHVGESLFGEVTVKTPRGVGWLRVVAYGAGDVPTVFRTTVISSSPFEHGWASSGSIVAWGDENSGANIGVTTPVASVAGSRHFELNIGARFVGALATHLDRGHVSDPNGKTTYLGPREVFAFHNPLLGRWNLELEPGGSPGTFASKYYLAGVFTPRLGIAGDWA